MPVDDLWYLNKRGPNGKRLPSKRHGQGKRWRVRFTDASGRARTMFFERKVDADAWDADARAGVARETRVDLADRQITFREYGERWRLSREIGWAVETRRRVESNLRLHLYPVFGDQPARSIRLTSVLEWLTRRLSEDTPGSTLRLYFELLDAVLAAAVADKLIPDNPCDGVKLAQVLRGVSRVPKWVPTEAEVLALIDAVPPRYRAAIWLGAGQGCRHGEALGMEDGTRCVDAGRGELHIVQQLRYSPKVYGGFYLSEPKARSSGTIDLDPVVAEMLADHVREFPPVGVELVDICGGDPVRRTVPLLFTTTRGRPFTDRTWSREWARWREAAGWPKEHGTFHALRHFFATTLITNHAEPQEVQRLLRHKTLRITLETYVHWWPKRERTRGLVGAALRAAAGGSHQP
ncbi:phage integrase family protein [Micromonospora sp. Llam0]|uniref:tyrosine-type recombinase/integrase n=1 Tax=Micromonospora sp. Llam0 TaxID=2485143 RepID=UPI000F48E1FF|nr:site-specific integrase [Micromonospora sp. Llam0]ROO52497.1 phage integrase family protein [Micromonospora sp. Llam0]